MTSCIEGIKYNLLNLFTLVSPPPHLQTESEDANVLNSKIKIFPSSVNLFKIPYKFGTLCKIPNPKTISKLFPLSHLLISNFLKSTLFIFSISEANLAQLILNHQGQHQEHFLHLILHIY